MMIYDDIMVFAVFVRRVHVNHQPGVMLRESSQMSCFSVTKPAQRSIGIPIFVASTLRHTC